MEERGQATAEWMGLVLGLALAFGGALTAARGADFSGSAHGLGEALSGRMTCAVRDACAHPTSHAHRHPPRRPAARAPDVRPHSLRDLARGVRPVFPPPSAPAAGRRLLRSLARAGEHAWLLCFGARRLRQELDHAQPPGQPISVHDALDVLNECVNPLGFILP
jgi:hypothetical protein